MRSVLFLVVVLLQVFSCKKPVEVLPTSYYGVRDGVFDLSWDRPKNKFVLSQFALLKDPTPKLVLNGDVSFLKSGFLKFKVREKTGEVASGTAFYGIDLPSIGLVFADLLGKPFLPLLTAGTCVESAEMVSNIVANTQDIAGQARVPFVTSWKLSNSNIAFTAQAEISLRDLGLSKTGPAYSKGTCANGLYQWSDNNIAFVNKSEFAVSSFNNSFQFMVPQSSFNLLNLRGTYKGILWSSLGNKLNYLEAKIDSFGQAALFKYDGIEQLESSELNPKSFAGFTVGTPNLLQSGVFTVDDFNLKGRMSHLLCSMSAYPNSLQIRVVSCVGQDPDDINKSLNILLVANN